MKKIDLSIIVLSYNTKVLLRQCLESVFRGVGNFGEFEIIVVDNGSTDGSVGLIQNAKNKTQSDNVKFKIILNEKNLGFARGNNQAIHFTQGKLLFFLNSDTIVKNGAIDKLMNFLEIHPEVAAVSPLLLNEDGSIQKDPCYLKFPTPVLVLFYYFKPLRNLANRFFPKLLYSTLNFTSPSEVDQLSGAALMIKKDIFEKIGGYDENFSHFFEDVDLSYRLRKANYKLFLVPQAEITHLKGRSLVPKVQKEGIESFYYLNFKSLFQFCQKNYSFYRFFLIKFIILAQLLLKLKFNLVKKLF